MNRAEFACLHGSRQFVGRSVSSDAEVYLSAEAQWQQDVEWFDEAITWSKAGSGNDSSNILTQFQNYFVVHGACMKILQAFIQYQGKIISAHPVKSLRSFVDACFDRQNESIDLWQGSKASKRQIILPGNWATFQSVEHSHLWFGARRFWTDPWHCSPGFEYLCADPIREPGVEAFISTILALPQPSRKGSTSSSSKQLKPLPEASLSDHTIMGLPQEILNIIVAHLSLKDALSLCSSSQKLLDLSDSRFWRLRTIQLHGCWFWELRDRPVSPQNDNWKQLLQILTANRFAIEQGAEAYWLTRSSSKNDKTKYRSTDCAKPDLLPLPLGLRNRQRIWMCLECVGITAEWELKFIQDCKGPR